LRKFPWEQARLAAPASVIALSSQWLPAYKLNGGSYAIYPAELLRALPHQDRALQADLEDALGDLLRLFGVERRAPFHRHVDGGDRERLALHHSGNPVFVCSLQSDPSPCPRRLITRSPRRRRRRLAAPSASVVLRLIPSCCDCCAMASLGSSIDDQSFQHGDAAGCSRPVNARRRGPRAWRKLTSIQTCGGLPGRWRHVRSRNTK